MFDQLRKRSTLFAPSGPGQKERPGPAPDANTTGDPAFNSPWSYTGLPTVSLPTGHFVDGLPLAIQLVGRNYAEADLLAAAAWCEQALEVKHLSPPEK